MNAAVFQQRLASLPRQLAAQLKALPRQLAGTDGLSKAGLAVLFLVVFALFIDERPLLGYLGAAIGAEEGLVRSVIVSGFLVLAAAMSIVTWAEWRKARAARAIDATASLRRDRPQDAQADRGHHT